MIGHHQILEARRRGLKPQAIFFDVDRKPEREAEDAIAMGILPVVYIRENENADLRFVRGCSIHVNARKWSTWLIALGQRLAEEGAKHVVMYAVDDGDDFMIFDGQWRTV